MSNRIQEVDARVVRSTERLRAKCSKKGCAKTCSVELAEGRHPGVGRFSWLRVPEGWWMYVPKSPLDVKSLIVRCPEHIEVAS